VSIVAVAVDERPPREGIPSQPSFIHCSSRRSTEQPPKRPAPALRFTAVLPAVPNERLCRRSPGRVAPGADVGVGASDVARAAAVAERHQAVVRLVTELALDVLVVVDIELARPTAGPAEGLVVPEPPSSADLPDSTAASYDWYWLPSRRSLSRRTPRARASLGRRQERLWIRGPREASARYLPRPRATYCPARSRRE
jgi:hypothetical protein